MLITIEFIGDVQKHFVYQLTEECTDWEEEDNDYKYAGNSVCLQCVFDQQRTSSDGKNWKLLGWPSQ